MSVIEVVERKNGMGMDENEWIKTFQRVELPEDLEFEHVKKWVNKIIVSNFKEVHVYLTMQRWRDYFPEEWLEE